nr:hypothetical protein [Paenibacillus sp. FJAT-26967]
MPVVYGPNDPQHRFFNYLKRMEDKRPFIFLEEGFSNFRWTYGYVEDAAPAISCNVEWERINPKNYNKDDFNYIIEDEIDKQITK